MNYTVPKCPKIYHITHVNNLGSIIRNGYLYSDAIMINHQGSVASIGMSDIKQRRLENELKSHPGLYVGSCVPFYFCPRSVMLCVIHYGNAQLTYTGGQEPIVHLEADLHQAVSWATNLRKWAFTLSNAGSFYFEDRADLNHLNEVNWSAVAARDWSAKAIKEGKQAEFLVEDKFPWSLIEKIGVYSQQYYNQVTNIISTMAHQPQVKIESGWYY